MSRVLLPSLWCGPHTSASGFQGDGTFYQRATPVVVVRCWTKALPIGAPEKPQASKQFHPELPHIDFGPDGISRLNM